MVDSGRIAVEPKLGLDSSQPVGCSRVLVPCASQAGPRDMGNPEGTVKGHVRHLLTRLNQRTLVEAAVWADRCRRQANP